MIREIFAKLFRSNQNTYKREISTFKPSLEQLEDRTVLSSPTITQTTDHTIIGWSNFNLGSGDSVTVSLPNSTQPSAPVTDLTQITQKQIFNLTAAQAQNVQISQQPGDVAEIDVQGTLIVNNLSADAAVVLNASKGVIFNENAVVNTNGLIATTGLTDSDFLTGNANYTGNSLIAVDQGASVTSGSFIQLFGQWVENDGTLNANETIALAAGPSIQTASMGSNQELVVTGTSADSASDVMNKGLLQTSAPDSSIVLNSDQDLFILNLDPNLPSGPGSNVALIKGGTVDLTASRDIDLTSQTQSPYLSPDLLDAAQSVSIWAGRDLIVDGCINIRSSQDVNQSKNNSYFTAGRDMTFNNSAAVNDFYSGDSINMSAGQTLSVNTQQEFFLPQNFSMSANTIDFENSENKIIANQDSSGNASLSGKEITFNNSGIQASVPLTISGSQSETFEKSYIVDSGNNLTFAVPGGNFTADHSNIVVSVFPENLNAITETLSISGNNVALQNNSNISGSYAKVLIQYQASFNQDSTTTIGSTPPGLVTIQKVTNIPPSPPPAPPTPPSPSNPPSSNQPANNSSTTSSSSSISFFDLFLNIFAAEENKLIGEFQQWESDLFKGDIAAAIAEENLMMNDLLKWDYVKNSLYEFVTALGITPETFAILAITKTIPITQAQQWGDLPSSH